MIVAPTLMALRCDPTPAACNADDCASGQVRVVQDTCVAPLAPGTSCNPRDPQDVCSGELSCINGRCVEGPTGVAAPCTLGQGCPFNDGRAMFCERASCTDGLGEVCTYYSKAFGSCDSNSTSPNCSPCEPGLTCTSGLCVKSCAVDADCPCESDGSPHGQCVNGQCTECRSLGARCDNGARQCCTDGQTCGEDKTCCLERTESCTSSKECCGTDACGSGACQQCKELAQQCSDASECCGERSCRNGVCSVPCSGEGNWCPVANKSGVCQDGVVECPTTGFVCKQVNFPSTEVCDRKDNDCDGKVDDIATEACSDWPPGCQGDFRSAGVYVCEGDEKVCNMRACDQVSGACDYCAGCSTSGSPCGWCPDHCEGSCPPNEACFSTGTGSSCGPDPKCPNQVAPRCWLPAQINTCM